MGIFNDSTFDYYVNNIGNWGDTKQKAYKNCDMNYEERNMVDKSIEAIVAIIDTSFDINNFSISDSVWNNSNEIADDGIDNNCNGYIDDIHGYNFL